MQGAESTTNKQTTTTDIPLLILKAKGQGWTGTWFEAEETNEMVEKVVEPERLKRLSAKPSIRKNKCFLVLCRVPGC
jgi:hypothetical protein